MGVKAIRFIDLLRTSFQNRGCKQLVSNIKIIIEKIRNPNLYALETILYSCVHESINSATLTPISLMIDLSVHYACEDIKISLAKIEPIGGRGYSFKSMVTVFSCNFKNRQTVPVVTTP